MNIGVRIPEHVIALITTIKTQPSCEKLALQILRRVVPNIGEPTEWRGVGIVRDEPRLYKGIVPLDLLGAKPGMILQFDWENEEEIVEVLIDWEYIWGTK
jgi:hypothetical protein